MADEEDASQEMHRAPTPPELMRSWHPGLFSDTERSSEPAVPRAVLDHHLETLTNRKQENEFEYFARLLAERELCPNLRPQTGPTGGGDSKVDSETYPVAPELAERWYYGEPGAAGERWAFAFSAKKDWRGKVKADVESIVSTGRPYKRIYFITNQYAPEKRRAEAEDKLSEFAGIPVTILDRTWILEKVYENRRLDLAVRALNMTGYAEVISERLGPGDTARQNELERLDAAVADPKRYDGSRYALAEDALESALLARGLERPRSEIEGRFIAAARAATEVGHGPQQLRIAYNRAWTAFWWFDDAGQFNDHYDEVAQFCLDSDDATDLELLLNLWQLLGPAVVRGTLTVDRAHIDGRGEALRASLKRVAGNEARPNNAALANTLLIVMRVSAVMQEGDPDDLIDLWKQFRFVLAQVEGLGDYPVERVHELITRMGEFVPESEAFDDLYDDLVALLERRRSEAEGGLAYLRRGAQKLEKGRYYDAIRMLGRAETRLIKAEYQDELVETLIGIGQAYSQAGLKWAARAKVLMAVNRLLSIFGQSGRLDPRAAVPLKFLSWLELELGRVPQAIGAIELYRAIVSSTEQPKKIAEKVPEQLQLQEAILGMLLMRSDLAQLQSLERAPDMLSRHGFELARAALLWALDGAEAVRKDGFAPEDESDAEIAEFFERWARQPAAEQIPARPILGEGDELRLRAVILGVEVVCRVSSNPDSLFLAESILASLESFLSTSLDAEVFPYRERVEFAVQPDAAADTPSIDMDELSREITIRHRPDDAFAGSGDYQAFADWLQEVLIRLTLSMLMIADPKRWMERVAGDEVGFGRALALGPIAVATRNIFGDHPKVFLADWLEPNDQRYGLKRKIAWTLPSSETEEGAPTPLTPGEGEPPDIFDPEAGGHTDRLVLSPVNTPLWDKARWRATGFAGAEDGGLPFLLFGFLDFHVGQVIFREWRERYGPIDQRDALRISIVRGIDQRNPAAYAVIVSAELEGFEDASSMLYLSSRINRMEPKDTTNLERFLKALERSGSYLLAPMALDSSASHAPIDLELAIQKHKLVVRQAWEIGDNDPDMSCLSLDDEPIVPEGVTDPPCRRALERLREIRARHQAPK